MIFITVGMEKFSFDRLLEAIDGSISSGEIQEDVFGQIGNSRYLPKSFKYKRFLPFNSMVEWIQKAKIVVAHGGVGTTLLCLELGKIPIIFPRFSNFAEHLDDHQIEFVKKMQKEKKILAAFNKQELITTIKNYSRMVNALKVNSNKSNKKNLINFLKKVIE